MWGSQPMLQGQRWHLTSHPEGGDFGCGLILGKRMTFAPGAEMLGSESNKTFGGQGSGLINAHGLLP